MPEESKKAPRFVSWAAVSSLPQAKKVSVDEQLATNQRHIERWGGVLAEELSIRGKSRNITLFEDACREIKEYRRLKELIQQRAFDVFIYLDRSRLGRKASLSMAVIELCHEAGIITYATESPPPHLEPPERNFHNKVVGAIESVLAQEEVVKIQYRHEMGMIARVKAGDFPGIVPYGWHVEYVNHERRPVRIIRVDENAKRIICAIYDLYLQRGMSVRAIRDYLRESGEPPPRGAGWTDSAISVILNLAWRYAGFVELNVRSKKRPYLKTESKWPALVSTETAKAVELERGRRARARRSVGKGVHRFSQIVFCKKCKQRMVAHYSWRDYPKSGKSTRIERFRCEYAGERLHPKAQIAGTYITDAVRKGITWLQEETNRRKLLEEFQDNSPAIRQSIAAALANIAKHDEAVQRADDAYVLGNMDYERYKRQIDNLATTHTKLQSELRHLEAQLEKELFDQDRERRLEELASEGLTRLESEDIAAANAWFLRHLRVWVDNDDPEQRIAIQYI